MNLVRSALLREPTDPIADIGTVDRNSNALGPVGGAVKLDVGPSRA